MQNHNKENGQGKKKPRVFYIGIGMNGANALVQLVENNIIDASNTMTISKKEELFDRVKNSGIKNRLWVCDPYSRKITCTPGTTSFSYHLTKDDNAKYFESCLKYKIRKMMGKGNLSDIEYQIETNFSEEEYGKILNRSDKTPQPISAVREQLLQETDIIATATYEGFTIGLVRAITDFQTNCFLVDLIVVGAFEDESETIKLTLCKLVQSMLGDQCYLIAAPSVFEFEGKDNEVFFDSLKFKPAKSMIF